MQYQGFYEYMLMRTRELAAQAAGALTEARDVDQKVQQISRQNTSSSRFPHPSMIADPSSSLSPSTPYPSSATPPPSERDIAADRGSMLTGRTDQEFGSSTPTIGTVSRKVLFSSSPKVAKNDEEDGAQSLSSTSAPASSFSSESQTRERSSVVKSESTSSGSTSMDTEIPERE